LRGEINSFSSMKFWTIVSVCVKTFLEPLRVSLEAHYAMFRAQRRKWNFFEYLLFGKTCFFCVPSIFNGLFRPQNCASNTIQKPKNNYLPIRESVLWWCCWKEVKLVVYCVLCKATHGCNVSIKVLNFLKAGRLEGLYWWTI
jgi:hypothetical protein